jgi:hypothetical protein
MVFWTFPAMVAPSPTATLTRSGARRCALACLLAALGAVALDAVVFRSGLYTPFLEPDSSTGIFEMTLRRERQAQERYGSNLVVTLGDSRFAYSPKLADEPPASGLILRHAGVAGTDIRSWYYMLRDLDPTAQRYRAVVFGVMDYDDEDEYYNPYVDIRALHYVIARLRLGDIAEFAGSFQGLALRWQTGRSAFLKGLVLQNDVLAFFSHPQRRLEYVELARHGYEEWTYNYLETPRSMAGISVDWAAWKVSFPPGMDQDQRDTVNAAVMRRPAPQIGRVAAFRREWFGRIMDRYRGSPTKIVFVRLPRGPVLRPEGLVRKLSSSIREFAARPNVLLAPEHAFDELERPELFRDGLHLNRAGIARFSPMLARTLAQVLEGAGAR